MDGVETFLDIVFGGLVMASPFILAIVWIWSFSRPKPPPGSRDHVDRLDPKE